MEKAKKCKELWDINNGETLCIACHKKTDSYANTKQNLNTQKNWELKKTLLTINHEHI